ncbi:MAG: hypothetical protein ACEQSC_00255 [Candidatus Nanopelagicaceae bacterium]
MAEKTMKESQRHIIHLPAYQVRVESPFLCESLRRWSLMFVVSHRRTNYPGNVLAGGEIEILDEILRQSVNRIALICEISLYRYSDPSGYARLVDLVSLIANAVIDLPSPPAPLDLSSCEDEFCAWVDGVFEANSPRGCGRKTYEGTWLENSGIRA